MRLRSHSSLFLQDSVTPIPRSNVLTNLTQGVMRSPFSMLVSTYELCQKAHRPRELYAITRVRAVIAIGFSPLPFPWWQYIQQFQ
jgi:hypothetical protein